MSTSYLPTQDSLLDGWLTNFKTLIAASPSTYSLSSADATAITNAYNSWHTAYTIATNPSTRTKSTILTKNNQKALVLAVVRGYAAIIRPNHAVSDELKSNLGLHVADTLPTPVPPPTTYPVLTINSAGSLLQDLRAADQTTPTRRAKPSGVKGLVLLRAVGTAAATSPESAEFHGYVTKAAFQSQFDSADDGKIATYFACWANAKGETGPWGPPVSMRVAA